MCLPTSIAFWVSYTTNKQTMTEHSLQYKQRMS